MRLESLGALSAFSAALLAVEQGSTAAATGVSLTYALQITALTSTTVRLASLAENAFNAVGAASHHVPPGCDTHDLGLKVLQLSARQNACPSVGVCLHMTP